MGIGRGGDQVKVPMGTKLCTYHKKKKKNIVVGPKSPFFGGGKGAVYNRKNFEEP